jgi:pSer/pThr/pTyr-binding forkhead associated (FHA) protein
VRTNDPIASAPSAGFNRTTPESKPAPPMRVPDAPPAVEARSAQGPSTSPGAHGPAAGASSGSAENRDARIVAILKDGSDGRSFPLHKDVIDLGRVEGDIVLSDDPYLSPRHARLTRRTDSWLLRDLDSVNGVYVRIREPVDLSDGDMLLIGQQVLRFETLPDAELPLGPASLSGVLAFGTPEVPRIARLVQYTTEGIGRDLHYLYRDETVIGRENGDIVFTDDPFLSRRHAALTIDRSARRFVLRDLGSSNGTAMRFRGERTLTSGDQFRIGRHLFRFEVQRGSPAGRA